jgi:hypothetical protein
LTISWSQPQERAFEDLLISSFGSGEYAVSDGLTIGQVRLFFKNFHPHAAKVFNSSVDVIIMIPSRILVA